MKRVQLFPNFVVIVVVTLLILIVGGVWLLRPTTPAQDVVEEVATDACKDSQGLTFSKTLTSTMPHDVDQVLNRCLLDKKKFAQAQRLHDNFSWNSFLAINWPVATGDTMQPFLTDSGLPLWTTWMSPDDIFKTNGEQPVWGASSMDRLDDTYQVSNACGEGCQDQLWDQNGNLVYYDIRINQSAFTSIVSHTLYTQVGQTEFYSNTIKGESYPNVFDWGREGQSVIGAMELKLAWKVLDETKGDIPERFFTVDTHILENNEWVPKMVGLVGLHLIHKTYSAREWIWATFEHVDNVQVNPQTRVMVDGILRPLKPLFYDPGCTGCPVNVPPKPNEQGQCETQGSGDDGVCRTQVVRVKPIPPGATDLNSLVQEILKTYESYFSLETDSPSIEQLDSGIVPQTLSDQFAKMGPPLTNDLVFFVEEPGQEWQIVDDEYRYMVRLVNGQLEIYKSSVWQYYELISTQWPTENSEESTSVAATNGFYGDPTVNYLLNTVIETYLQPGNSNSTSLTKLPNNSGTPGLDTQSCMACHAGAPMIACLDDGAKVAGKFRSADFSWLLWTEPQSALAGVTSPNPCNASSQTHIQDQ